MVDDQSDADRASEPAGNPPAASIVLAMNRLLEGELAKPLSPGLYVVATPIGHLCDFSLRGAAVLARCDTILCEDTRHSRKLCNAYGLRTRLAVYEEHSAERMRPKVLSWLQSGQRVGLISDAGTPLISDPGYKLVRAVIDDGHAVTSIPGANAATAALAASGLPTDTFHFLGFLPTRSGQRQRRLAGAAPLDGVLLCYEAASRLPALLRDVGECLGERRIVVARELTKHHESWLRGPVSTVLKHVETTPVKGELTVLIAGADQDGAPATDARRAQLDDALLDALATMTVRDAARAVSADLQLPRTDVYQRALVLSQTNVTEDR
ncbi:MAG: 16S rRNA (cytidine(1402)-2'-O)-methyltransferase [Pseudomonadota bacterium]